MGKAIRGLRDLCGDRDDNTMTCAETMCSIWQPDPDANAHFSITPFRRCSSTALPFLKRMSCYIRPHPAQNLAFSALLAASPWENGGASTPQASINSALVRQMQSQRTASCRGLMTLVQGRHLPCCAQSATCPCLQRGRNKGDGHKETEPNLRFPAEIFIFL